MEKNGWETVNISGKIHVSGVKYAENPESGSYFSFVRHFNCQKGKGKF
jgi:hypothetical protein